MLQLRRLPASVTVLALIASTAWADTVVLKNGREVRGKVLDDGKETVRVKTDGGILTLRRADIESVRIDGSDDGSRRPPAPVDPETPAEPVTPGRPLRSDEPWTWAPEVSRERVAELTPVRDRLLTQLAALGPTREKRLEALACSAEERTKFQALVQDFDDVRRRGNAVQRRNAARDEMVGLGMKALPFLVEGLAQGNHWTRRMSAQALQRLMQTPGGGLTTMDARWLVYNERVPAKLMALLRTQGDADAAFVRVEMAGALGAVTGQTIPYPQDAQEPSPTAAEIEATRAWAAWWQRAEGEWGRSEEEKERLRGELLRKLGLVRVGQNPE